MVQVFANSLLNYSSLRGVGKTDFANLYSEGKSFGEGELIKRVALRLLKNEFRVLTAALLTMLLAVPAAHAQDKIEMELTVVKGNKELPKVLYIVPWKRLADGDIQQKLVLHSLFEDAFNPIEPQTFERYVDDYRYFANSQPK